jgi:hypothetical protein
VFVEDLSVSEMREPDYEAGPDSGGVGVGGERHEITISSTVPRAPSVAVQSCAMFQCDASLSITFINRKKGKRVIGVKATF